MAAWNWRFYGCVDALRGDAATVRERLAGVNAPLVLLVKDWRIEIRGTE